MRKTALLLALALAAGSVSAQRPLRQRRAASATTTMLQTVTVDIASAFQQHYRATIEPLVFGRFTIGLSGEYTTEPDESNNYIAYPLNSCPPQQLCDRAAPYDYGGYGYQNPRYRAWSFVAHARWYPSALSFTGQRQSASFYAGEFIGFHERRTSQVVYYGCPYCESPPPPDSGIANPDSSRTLPGGPLLPPGNGSLFTQTMRGWEPGVEFGVRVIPMRHLVMDVGGRFRLARLNDPQSGKQAGDIDSRLLVSFGVGW